MLSSLRAALPTDRHWEPVDNGESGAGVFKDADGSRYAKCVTADQVAELERERDRVEWLGAAGVSGPRVLDWLVTAAGACLITSAVEGVAADAVPAETLLRAWDSIADAVRQLHNQPAASCPFDRGVARMFAIAQDVVARDAVHPEFLPEEQRSTPPAVLLARLAAGMDRRLAQEATETVVCHGDLCLPNIILNPDTWSFAGFIDLARLGVADPYVDIALLLANSRETWTDEAHAQRADLLFAQRYGIDLDTERQRFYLHLDPLTWG